MKNAKILGDTFYYRIVHTAALTAVGGGGGRKGEDVQYITERHAKLGICMNLFFCGQSWQSLILVIKGKVSPDFDVY
jgi:hypothetical protein